MTEQTQPPKVGSTHKRGTSLALYVVDEVDSRFVLVRRKSSKWVAWCLTVPEFNRTFTGA